MTIQVESKKERPSADVPWYQFPPTWSSVLARHGVTYGIFEPNPLTRVTTLNFASKEAYDAWAADADVIKEITNLDNYLAFAKITKTERQLGT